MSYIQWTILTKVRIKHRFFVRSQGNVQRIILTKVRIKLFSTEGIWVVASSDYTHNGEDGPFELQKQLKNSGTSITI